MSSKKEKRQNSSTASYTTNKPRINPLKNVKVEHNPDHLEHQFESENEPNLDNSSIFIVDETHDEINQMESKLRSYNSFENAFNENVINFNFFLYLDTFSNFERAVPRQESQKTAQNGLKTVRFDTDRTNEKNLMSKNQFHDKKNNTAEQAEYIVFQTLKIRL
ncbi:unnamed protein product [Brachionus calyciflorus]|uniref:Uncharacterized protein n=1 Tax=Brachionus calyciflorus TaxID=104777 RepID=A0A814JT45_9BILA|nr:unnamed protein product [Brachionus calyciflorus]